MADERADEVREVTEADLDNMNEEQLMAVARGETVELGDEDKPKVEETKEEEPQEEQTQPQEEQTPVQKAEDVSEAIDKKDYEKAQDGSITINVGDRTLKFKSETELFKSYKNAQELIERQQGTLNKFNAERGKYGSSQKELEQAQQKINNLSQQLQKVQAANPAATKTLDALLKGNLNTQQQQQASQDPAISQMAGLQNEITELSKLKQDVSEMVQTYRQQQQQQQVDAQLKGLYGEIKDFQRSNPEYATSTPFEKIDDLVSEHGDGAKAMVDPQDYKVYEALLDVASLYKGNENGVLDLSRKNFNDLNEAYLIHQNRNGKLSQSIVQARRRGIDDYDKALSGAAQSAKNLPNSTTSKESIEIGSEEAERIMGMDPEKIAADPDLKKKFDAIAKHLGVAVN